MWIDFLGWGIQILVGPVDESNASAKKVHLRAFFSQAEES